MTIPHRDGDRGDSLLRLGPLESRVLEALWDAGAPCRVKDLLPGFPEVAYTTLMTTMERLHRKGLLLRMAAGRAFAYAPRLSREELSTRAARRAIQDVVASGAPVDALLSFFVNELGARDVDALDELERLVRLRRRGGGGTR